MQPPIFNIPHPSIHSTLDDTLPQLPPTIHLSHPQTHPLNLSNHSDQSNSLPTNTTATTTTPRNIAIPNLNRCETKYTPFNEQTHTTNIYASPPMHSKMSNHLSNDLNTDTLTLFDETDRWTNINSEFFSPETGNNAWQTMFPPLSDNMNLNMSMNMGGMAMSLSMNDNNSEMNGNGNGNSPYKKSRPTPLSIPNPETAPHTQTQTGLTADICDMQMQTGLPQCVSAPVQPMQYTHTNQSHRDELLPLPNLNNGTFIQNYDHSMAMPIPFQSHTNAHMPSYPTRIALPIVPSAYQNVNPSFWQKQYQNPYFNPPNSAPIHHRMPIPMPPHTNIKRAQSIPKKEKPKVKRKRGRPRKYKRSDVLQTPSPKKRKICKRSADRKNLSFVQYLKGDGTGPEMQIDDLSPHKKGGNIGPNAKGFQRGGLRRTKTKKQKRCGKGKGGNVLRIIGGKDKSYKKPPLDHEAYNRIRVWKDTLGRQFYDCICNARKPVQDLNKIKSHVLGHDKIVWVCDICGREFFNNHLQLNAHMKTHKKRAIKVHEQPTIIK